MNITNTSLIVTGEGKKTVISPDTKSIFNNKKLTNLPARILAVLLSKTNELHTFDDILIQVWGDDADTSIYGRRTLDVHLCSVRNFLDECELKYEILRVKNHGLILKTN